MKTYTKLLLSFVMCFLLVYLKRKSERHLPSRHSKPARYNFHNLKMILPREKKFNFTKRNRKIRKYFEARRQRVIQECEGVKNVSQTLSREQKLLMVNFEPKKKIGVCRTAKHGSTTLSNIFLQLYTRS